MLQIHTTSATKAQRQKRPMLQHLEIVHKHTPAKAWLGLTIIYPNKQTYTRWYQPHELAALMADAMAVEDRANVYIRMTAVAERPATGRGLERDSAGSSVLWVDYDSYGSQHEGIARLQALPQPPTLLINSGNGLHAVWLLDRFYIDVAAIKARNKGLMLALDDKAADSCFDLARVLRLVGTFNIKRDVPQACAIIDYTPERVYTLDQFAPAILDANEDTPIPEWDSEPLPDDFSDSLPVWLWDRIRSEASALAAGAKLNGTGVDRSKNDFFIASSLLELGYSPAQVLSVLTHDTWFSGAKYRDTGRYNYAVLTLRSAHKQTGTPMITVEMPERTNGKVVTPLDDFPPLPASAQLPKHTSNGACTWLDEYIAFSRYWSPRSYDAFHEAVGLWVLSTVAARRVRVPFGGDRFSHLYIALCGRTSVYAKSTAAKIGMDVLRESGLDHLLAADESTPQALIRSLTVRVPDNFDDLPQLRQERIRMRLPFAAQRGWFYDEFGQKLHAMMRSDGTMADFRGLLRRFDDCPERYEYDTIGRGSDIVERPYLALLASFTPADMKPFANRGASLWNDGFFARFAFVVPPSETARTSAEFPSGQRTIPSSLIEPLQAWHTRLGIAIADIQPILDKKEKPTGKYSVSFGYTIPGMTTACTLGDGVHTAFYAYHNGLTDIVTKSENSDLDGNYTRFAEKALRVAMLFASLENGNRIELRHWARAQEITERWRRSLHYLIPQVAAAEPSAKKTLEDRAIRIIQQTPDCTSRTLQQKLGISSAEAAQMIDGLRRVGVIRLDPTGRKTIIRLKEAE